VLQTGSEVRPIRMPPSLRWPCHLTSRGVSSNTKVKLFVSYFEGLDVFRTIARAAPGPNPIRYLRTLDQEKTCHIAEAADACLALTHGLARYGGVSMSTGSVSDASQSEVSVSIPTHPTALTNQTEWNLDGDHRDPRV
jgi:hypothetical protein